MKQTLERLIGTTSRIPDKPVILPWQIKHITTKDLKIIEKKEGWRA